MSEDNGKQSETPALSTGTVPAVCGRPHAILIGDFNTGKSTVVNALLKEDLVYTSRTESHSLPAFLGASAKGAPVYWRAGEEGPVKTTRKKWLSLRGTGAEAPEERALGMNASAHPFSSLILVDTPGLSGDSQAHIDLNSLGADPDVLLVLVTDIEYWNARHTIELIGRHIDAFRDRLMLLGNKADHLNLDEITRIAAKARNRMERAGIADPPEFLPVSARLELARHTTEDDEYRHRTKRPVRQQCDWSFDQFRVRLYEFERRRSLHPSDADTPPLGWSGLIGTRLIDAFAPKDDAHEVR